MLYQLAGYLAGWLAKPEAYVVSKMKYMTSGPKLYNFSVLSPRICFYFVNLYFLVQIATFFEIFKLAVSKHDLKPSGTFFENLHAALDSQVPFLLDFCPPEGD